MGFLSEIKKLLFVQKAVAKSAADKAVKAGKEKGEELMEKGGDFFEKAKDKTGDIVEDLSEKVGDIFEKTKGKASDIATKAKDNIENLMEKKQGNTDHLADSKEEAFSFEQGEEIKPDDNFAEDLGSATLDKAKEVSSKLADMAENIGGKVLDKSGAVGEKAMDLAEDIGGKVIEKAGSLWDKAKALGGDLTDKMENLVDKAQEAASKENIDDTINNAKDLGDQVANKVNDGTDHITNRSKKLKESLLDNKDSFFEKAKQYADGEYHAEGKLTMKEKPAVEGSLSKKKGKVKGFEDRDGDGNELIDDAIVE